MKHFLLFTFLTLAALSTRAQNKLDCLYRIKFYNWQWDYCSYIDWDTIPRYSLEGDYVSDTAIWDTLFTCVPRNGYRIKYPLPDSLVKFPQALSVTSYAGNEPLEVENFEMEVQAAESTGRETHNIKVNGPVINPGQLGWLNTKNIVRISFSIKLKGREDLIETWSSEVIVYK